MSTNKKLYICVTDGCSLACKGCYKYLYNITHPSFLDLNIVRKYINNFLINNPNDTLDCTFHGGEPFYIGNLQNYIDLMNEYKAYPQIKWSATTNLIYKITPLHISLFNMLSNKFIKTSWDVDDYRFKTSNQLELWENNVKLLLKEGFTIQPIITVNNQTILHDPKELFEYFKNLNIKNINFERITEAGRATQVKVKPTNRETDDWLYKVYLLNKEYNFDIPIFNELLESYKIGYSGCRKRECMQDVRTINTDGSIGACPNCSNVYIIDKEGNYNQEQENTLIKMEKDINIQCRCCKFYKICHGDCSQLAWDETGCPGLTKILENI